MRTIKVKYGGFETEQQVEECLYNAIYDKALDDVSHELKEILNQEIPINYKSTRPYFTLDNTRTLIDMVVGGLKRGEI